MNLKCQSANCTEYVNLCFAVEAEALKAENNVLCSSKYHLLTANGFEMSLSMINLKFLSYVLFHLQTLHQGDMIDSKNPLQLNAIRLADN